MESGIGQIFLILINNYGLIGAILIIALILAIFYGLVVGFKYFTKFIFSKVEHHKRIKLKNHPFFDDLDFLINHKLKNVKTSCVIRKQIYIDIMTIRLDSIKKIFYNLVQQDISGLSAKELYHKVLLALDDANTSAITGAVAKGVPIFVLNSMNEKRKMINKLYYNAIKGYCYNNYIYANNNERMYAILEMVCVYVECYMNVLQENLAEFNGDIKHLVYKGVSCIDCPSCIHDQYLAELKQEIKKDSKKTQGN